MHAWNAAAAAGVTQLQLYGTFFALVFASPAAMSSQDWAPVVITKKKPPTGTTVKDVDAVRGAGRPAARVCTPEARARGR